jgi:hypothetical protein
MHRRTTEAEFVLHLKTTNQQAEPRHKRLAEAIKAIVNRHGFSVVNVREIKQPEGPIAQ